MSTRSPAVVLDALPRHGRPGAASAPLTRRQLEVLRCFAWNRTYDQVARELYVTRSTVDTQLERVRRKLGVHTSAAAVDRALALGLISAEAPS